MVEYFVDPLMVQSLQAAPGQGFNTDSPINVSGPWQEAEFPDYLDVLFSSPFGQILSFL